MRDSLFRLLSQFFQFAVVVLSKSVAIEAGVLMTVVVEVGFSVGAMFYKSVRTSLAWSACSCACHFGQSSLSLCV